MVFIPYGGYWSSPFVRWQGALSHLHSVELAAHVTRDALGARGLDATDLDLALYGWTVIQPEIFYAGPWFTALIGAEGLACPVVNQACATGARLLATAAGEMLRGAGELALIASGDRTSNGAHVYHPAPHAPGGTGRGEDWVMGSFERDPWARGAMVDTAETAAARESIDTEEQHALVMHRFAQYQMALAQDRAFQKRFMTLPFGVPDARFRKTVGEISGDEGVQMPDADKMARLKPVRPGGTVTYAGQTHPADGCAGMIVARDRARAREIGQGRAAEVLAVSQAREAAGLMPLAPIRAAARALEAAGLGIGEIDVVKSHNPFAVNDIAFARAVGIDWREMNNYGSSLIWGHPQGPTGLRAMIEMIEELEIRGGGTGLFQGCAAGDSAMAVVLRLE